MSDTLHLDFESTPTFIYSAFRHFEPGEKHLKRICSENVLLIVLSGVLRFSENGIKSELSQGEYYIQPKGLKQEGYAPSDVPNYYFIHFIGNISYEASGLSQKGTFSKSKIVPLLKKFETCKNTPNCSLLQKQICFYSILDELNKNEVTLLPDSDKLLAEKMMHYFETNFASFVSLDALSEQLHYTNNYLIRKFKASYHTTPYNYIIRLRIAKAESLLISSNHRITDIALESGFSDFSSFYRSFFKKNRCSPKQFRQSQFL